MPDEQQQQQPIAEQQPEAQQQDFFDPEDHVEKLFEAFNNAGRRTPKNTLTPAEPASASAGTDSLQESASTAGADEASAVSPQDAGYWQQKAETFEKRYNDLQSDIDRRINVQTKQMREEFGQQMQQLLGAVMAARQPQAEQAPTSFNEAVNDEHKMQAYFQNLVRTEAQNLLNNDPRVQAGAVLSDYSRFEQEHPEVKANPSVQLLMEPALRGFQGLNISTYEKLNRAYSFATDIINRAQQASAPGVAAKANGNGQTTTPPQSNGQRVTGQQQQQLLERAQSYVNEQGVAAQVTTKPNIDPYDPRKLRENIQVIVGSLLK